jgi:sec-independent protein translocase protein TatC
LLELRRRLIYVLLTIGGIFLLLVPFANSLYLWVARPLTRILPPGASLIATEVATPLLTPLKLTFVLAIFISMPFVFYQLWRFIAPGLYRSEKRIILLVLTSSSILFYLGIVFCYLLVFPLVFAFFTQVAPSGVAIMTDINKYLSFVLKLFFGFGIAFEVPVIILVGVWAKLVTLEQLSRKRPYLIVGFFIIGMLLTPPDVFSQALLALPMWGLFELGLLMAKYGPKIDLSKPDV